MKILMCLLVLLPLAFCAPADDDLVRRQFGINLDSIKTTLCSALSPGHTQAECEQTCHDLAHNIVAIDVIDNIACHGLCPVLDCPHH